MIERISLETAGMTPCVFGAAAIRPRASRAGFGAALERAVKGTERKLAFSIHAKRRLESRGVFLSQVDQTRLERAVDAAAAKGAREALLLMDRLAFVVSVPRRTVITALDGSDAEDHVFTQIDSAVVVAKQPPAPFGKGTRGLDPFLGKPEGRGTTEAAPEIGEVFKWVLQFTRALRDFKYTSAGLTW